MKLTSHPTAARPAFTLPIAARFVVMALAFPLLVACQPEKGKNESGAAEETPPAPAPAPVDPAPPESPGGEKVDELTLKRLLCRAAAMDRKQWEEIAVKGNIDLEALIADGETLTEFVVFRTSRRPQEGEELSLRFEGTTDPATLAEALDPGSRRMGLVSVLQVNYINSLEYKIDGDTLTGNVTVEAKNKAYEGAFGFEAIRDDSQEDGWVITAFVLAEESLRIEREDQEGPWKRVAK